MKKYFYLLLLFTCLSFGQIEFTAIKLKNSPVTLNDTTQVDLLVREKSGPDKGLIRKMTWSYFEGLMSSMINTNIANNVPYVGATANLHLNSKNIYLGAIGAGYGSLGLTSVPAWLSVRNPATPASGNTVTVLGTYNAAGLRGLYVYEDEFGKLQVNNRGGAQNSATNTSFGVEAGQSITTALRVVAIGYGALRSATTATATTAFGNYAGSDVTTGGWNSFIGGYSGRGITTGINNLHIKAGSDGGSFEGITLPNALSGLVTGHSNVLIGTVKNVPSDANKNVIIANGQGTRLVEKNEAGDINFTGTTFKFNNASFKSGILNITMNTTITEANFGTNGTLYVYVNALSGAVTVTLPTAAGMAGYTVKIIKIDNSANTVTVIGNVNINQSSTFLLTSQNSNVSIISNSNQYWVL